MANRVHVFETAGLGTAPYAYRGMEKRQYQACHGAPIQPGGSCDYCGTAIYYHYFLQGSGPGDKPFKVGSDCIGKAGKGGMKTVLTGDEARLKADRKKIEDEAAEARALAAYGRLAEVADALRAQPHPKRADLAHLTLLSYVEFLFAQPTLTARVKAARIVAKHLPATEPVTI